MENKKYPQRKRMRLPEYDYGSAGYYFITICTQVRQKDILSSIHPVGGGLCAAPQVTLTPLGEIVDAAINTIPILHPGAEIDTYCIMPDHVHLIIVLTGRHRGRPLPDIVGQMKSPIHKHNTAHLVPLGDHTSGKKATTTTSSAMAPTFRTPAVTSLETP